MIRLWQWWRRYRLTKEQQRQLLAMDSRTLKDLGISRVDAEQLAGCYGRGIEKGWRDKV
ncbi:DUF1127 domain-containing protein [Geothermobacter hydrogeniphilus]|uniref:YjiS-like domain-containing protein n=1 Tax=Geothermobacter hydrogeniphilus TaxID=1969733 RepID=A0A1X0Y0H0_9BACT|nr:DUF1127 domain-containing protein [Geothermobacter hydrogeniphilus]ORJ58607.1 hypothetical protein B5V00_12215 [Geothermobacter hydrogeniphilus]